MVSSDVPGAPSAPRPRILRCITRLNVGGPARHALLLSLGLSEYETTLVAGHPTAAEGELTHPDVPIHRVPLVRPPNPPLDIRSLSAVRRLIVERRPALLHTHMAKAGTVGRLAALTVRPRPRTIHTFHGHVLDGYFGPRARRGIIEMEAKLARTTDVLVAVSPEIRDELLALGIGKPSQFRVIHVGLELGPFLAVKRPSGRLRAEIGVSPSTPLVGVVGRLVPIKDHPTLFDAMRLLPGVHLAVIGDGELRAELESLVRRLELGDRVHFTGWWADMADAVADLDVVALTSRNEGTPVALIEASAAARPVLATDVGGVRSVVVDGATGVVAPRGDSQTVAELLRRLLADPDERSRMGLAGRDHVADRFGEATLLEEVRALYAELLAFPRRRRVLFTPPTG